MTDTDAWWLLAGLLLTVASLLCARHIPGGQALTDGNPSGPPTYTDHQADLAPFFGDYAADTRQGDQ